MKIKICFFAILAVIMLLFSTCDFLNGGNNGNDNICEHDWQWVETIAPTETEAAIETKTCKKCEATDGTREGRPAIGSGETSDLPCNVCGTLPCSCDEDGDDNTNDSDIDDGNTDDSQGGDGDENIHNEDDPLIPVIPSGTPIVGPLLQTNWGQGTAYRSLLPGGSRPGCVGVAIAQIMRFHEHPFQGSGQSETYITSHGVNVPSVNFAEFYFDWDNTLDRYTSTGGTELERKTIAEIYYNVCVGLKMNFGNNGGGGGVSTGPLTRGLTTFFGYDKSIQRLSRLYYDDATWEAIIKEQLDAGLPVRYGADGISPGSSDHAYVIDGYDDDGKFHVNMGWNGSQDGWYYLNEVPNYNANQRMIINIKPDQGSVGSNEMALAAFSTNKTTVSQNELFTLTVRTRSAGFFPGGERGVALVDTNGSIVEVMGAGNFNALDPASFRNSTINCFVPITVTPGQYSLRFVTRIDGGEWKLVTVSNISEDIPSEIPFTVTAETGTRGGGYGMGLTAFSASTTTVSQNVPFTVTYTFRNMGTEVFPGGQAAAALMDNDNNIVALLGIRTPGVRNPGSTAASATMDCTVPGFVTQGNYQLRMVIRPGNNDDNNEWRVATLSLPDVPTSINFTVSQGTATPGGGYGMAVSNFSASKTSVAHNEPFTVSARLRNDGMETFPGGNYSAALVNDSGMILVIVRTSNSSAGTREPGAQTSTLTMDCTVQDTVPPGQYKLMIIVRTTGNEWRVVTDSYNDSPTSINFEVR